MEYAIQRRGIYLMPPSPDDLLWMFAQLDVPQIYQMFGHNAEGRVRIAKAYKKGALIVGILRNASTRKRIGFVIVFPPSGFDFWEFAYAIPDEKDRDAFSALNAADAMCHYLFDRLHIEALGWRVRSDNAASDAVIRRIGYKPYETTLVDGHDYTFYRLDREGWIKRREKLERGEATHPSGIGSAFQALPEPYTPILTGED